MIIININIQVLTSRAACRGVKHSKAWADARLAKGRARLARSSPPLSYELKVLLLPCGICCHTCCACRHHVHGRHA